MAIRLNPACEGSQTITLELGNTEFTITGVVTSIATGHDREESQYPYPYAPTGNLHVELRFDDVIMTRRRIHAEPHFHDGRGRHNGPFCACKCDRCHSAESNKCICPGCKCSDK